MKKDLREKIINYRYEMANESIWDLLDAYDRQLEMYGTLDELAEAAFLRGEAAFHMGRYYDTVKALTKSVGIEKTQAYSYLEADAYNMLGMLFSFVGYETVALDNYLSAVDSAQKNRNVREEISSLLNTGILYQGLLDYRKAMNYYKKARETADGSQSHPEMMMTLLCLIQEAQLLCRLEKFDEAQRMLREIDSYYRAVAQGETLLPKCMLEVRIEDYLGNERKRDFLIKQISEYLETDSEYLEQIDFYVDFCSFLLESGRKDDTRRMIDALKEKLASTEFFHLRIQMEEMEVQYQKKYGTDENYLLACGHYMSIQREYDQAIGEFRRQSLSNIENLQELERQKKEFEFRSKCDLATGLLNKETFRHEVEIYLSERNRDVTDVFVLIDIDNFKLVNDSFGHLVGDEVIARLAKLMKDIFRNGELCGRFGGDEFVVFLKNVDDIAGLEVRVESLRERFADINFGKNGNVHSTVSIGVSYNRDINASYKTMFDCADEALMKAKEYGKDRVTFFEIKRGLLKYV